MFTQIQCGETMFFCFEPLPNTPCMLINLTKMLGEGIHTPKFNTSPLKNDAWKIILSLNPIIFLGWQKKTSK